MSEYQFDAARWCESMKLAHFRNKDYTTAENFKQTKLEIERLKAELAALKAAARKMFDADQKGKWDALTYDVSSAELKRLCGEE